MPKQIEFRGKRLAIRYTEGDFVALVTLALRYDPDNKLQIWIPRHNAGKHLLELEIEISALLEHVRARVGAEPSTTHAGD